MKRIVVMMTALALTQPASAAGIADLARVVLGNGAVLQRSSDSCGAKASLSLQDLAMIALARTSAQKALPADQFASLTTAANTSANTQAQSPDFCQTTAKKKNVLLDAVKKAGEKLVTARVLKI